MQDATTDSAPAGPAAGFAAFGLDSALLASLAELGYEEPTPIQRESIPPLVAGRDLLGQAGTGTGKTAAFALPLLQRLAAEPAAPNRPRALVLVPTRELAMQVAEAIHRYGRNRHVRVLPIYGGSSFGQQLRALDRGVEIVVATPGRALDHLTRGTLVLEALQTVVLDEADEMLDMGFSEDLDAILQQTPAERQTALFSATLPPRILDIAEQHLREPVRISIARERTARGEVPRVRQVAYIVQRAHKAAALGRILDMESPGSAIVFCRTRVEVDGLVEAMAARGYSADALHGGFMQDQRDRVMKRFRAGQTDLLIATDVAARGLDIDHVTHVVNYDVPTDPDAYVHRIGRTGRAGREGVAITLAQPREHRLLKLIERVTGQRLEIGRLPTVADLRNRRMELTRATLEEALVAGGLESFHALAEELASEADPLDVAAAALKLYHEQAHASEAQQEQDVPDASLEHERRGRFERGGRFQQRERFEREHPESERAPRPEGDARGFGAPREPRAPRFGPHAREDQRAEWSTTRLFIGLGRMAGVRPGDLVGAIANEAGVPGNAIGGIQIADRFSLVEVPVEAAEQVLRALRGTTIRGRRVFARYDRDSGG